MADERVFEGRELHERLEEHGVHGSDDSAPVGAEGASATIAGVNSISFQA